MFDIVAGKENGVEWSVNTTKVDPIIVSVKSAKGQKTVSVKCTHRPIFGYDADDMKRVETVLDELINECLTS